MQCPVSMGPTAWASLVELGETLVEPVPADRLVYDGPDAEVAKKETNEVAGVLGTVVVLALVSMAVSYLVSSALIVAFRGLPGDYELVDGGAKALWNALPDFTKLVALMETWDRVRRPRGSRDDDQGLWGGADYAEVPDTRSCWTCSTDMCVRKSSA
jgi:hypothetical protein